MNKNLIARATTEINAPLSIVWGALTRPKIIKQYMFGTEVVTDWQVGSQIVWKGEWQGNRYEDKGKILALEAERRISYSHFSPLSGQPDVPENYHTVSVELERRGDRTLVTLTQDNNATEEDRAHSEQNWKMMIDGLKNLLEKYLSEDPSVRLEDMEK